MAGVVLRGSRSALTTMESGQTTYFHGNSNEKRDKKKLQTGHCRSFVAGVKRRNEAKTLLGDGRSGLWAMPGPPLHSNFTVLLRGFAALAMGKIGGPRGKKMSK